MAEYICDGIPDAAIEAGCAAWDRANHEMERYVSGVSTDWNEGMIVAAIYKAMREVIERLPAFKDDHHG